MTALHPLARRVRHPAPLRRTVSRWLVSAGLFAAPAAWGVQLLVSYLLNGDSCRIAPPLHAVSFGPKSTLLAMIGVVAVASCLLGLWAAHVTWRLTRKEGLGDHHEGLTAGAGRTRFLGLCGIVVSWIFLIGAAFALLVPFLVSPCAVPFS